MLGQPVPAARVAAKPRGVVLAAALRYVEADQDGRFTISHLEWGTYWILAMKDEEGYPSMSLQFYSNGRVPLVALSAASPVVKVDATVGPKAAVVTGIVVDDANGTLVRPTIHLWRQNTPEDGVRISLPPKFRLLVPPDEDIGFELEAEDHEAWTFPGPLHLQSGSTLNLEVRVRAKAPQ
ncbi:MAG: hypothetical protein ABSH24_36685 [Bryobacteraceae bacterium]|jgi:hypothetical protein